MGDKIEPEDVAAFRRASLIYPQPVALSCGRVLRARSAQEIVDASLRAAEILCRYVAAVAISSYASRSGTSTDPIVELNGNLSFGNFLSAAQRVTQISAEHPAASYLNAGFKAKKGGQAGPTDSALQALLQVRNEIGHDLNTLDAAKARAILAKNDPTKRLADAIQGVDGLLNLPLFVIEDQQFERKAFHARRLVLMGESNDPSPEEIELTVGVDERNIPYIAISQVILKLPPSLIWDLIEEKANYQLLFVDCLDGNKTQYRTALADRKEGKAGASDELRNICAGQTRAAEETRLADGRHLAQEWTQRRKLIEEAAQRGEGLIPWELLDAETMKWMAGRLDNEKGEADPARVLQLKLLDGRTSIDGHERRQLVLLFGKPEAVSAELRRGIIMLQVQIKDPRWDERALIEGRNLVFALRAAIEFLSSQFKDAGLTFDGLANSDGRADYVAIRECLINQFIHQDYTDASAPAQIVIRSTETMLFNAGHSLVDPDQLNKGGRSQSRNPLIARAFKLIGFADLGGSGIRVLENAWKRARRRPPRFENNREGNNFTLTLDWRPLPSLDDEFWHGRIGVRLTGPQAESLDLIRVAPRTAEEISRKLRVELPMAESILEHLERQVLIQKRGEMYGLMEHMREILG